jgi:hypothetical protein
MDAIGLNPIKLDAIGLDPIRMNAIRLGVPGASSDSARPYIDPELLSHVKMAISTWGKTNDDPDRTVLKDLSGNGNDMRLLNFGFTEGSGYGLPGTDFEGWLCTDGVDDIIESVKPVSEMLEGSNKITVVSIIHQISLRGISDIPLTNYIRESNIGYVRNELRVSLNKTGIYGYTCFNIQSPISSNSSVINNILGDKEDYRLGTYGKISNAKLSVQGFIDSSGAIIDTSQVAYAGGFIANKVLTTDEINQIIAYFNLDRPGQIIKPQLYCNIKKQGITNDNHAEFNDQLIDFVGGRNVQLNNVTWEGESGINSYPVVFGANKTWETYAIYNFTGNINGNKLHITHIEHANNGFLFSYVKREGQILNKKEIPSFKIKISGLEGDSKLLYLYLKTENATGGSSLSVGNGVHELPKSFIPTESLQSNIWVGFTISSAQEGVFNFDCDITLEVLPTIENALCLDGISDFGKATGLPVLKDYTICALRKWLYGDSVTSTETGSIVSKSKVGNDGAFILEQTFNRNPSRSSTFSFGTINSLMSNDKLNEESFTYQTKYSYNGETIVSGSGVDIDSMWLGTIRDGDSRFSKLALWSLMLFPYSLSEFLLERQLRKYKAGTLYPDMIEFRPIVKSNIPYLRILYFITSTGDQIIKGSYIPIGSVIQINIQTVNATDEISSVSVNGKEVDMYNKDETYWRYRFKVTKSPQKINIVISSYLTMLGNETLINNETLIKNE